MPLCAAHLSGAVADHVASLAPRPALAVNDTLGASAQFHSAEMADHGYFDHRSAVTGEYTNELVRRHGYPLPSWYPDAANNVESIAGGHQSASSALEGFMNSDGHRQHLMGEVSFFLDHREDRDRVRQRSGIAVWALLHGAHRVSRRRPGTDLTGVVFSETHGDNFMDVGEGLAGVTVSAAGTSVDTNDGGGWSIAAGPGTWEVTASGWGAAERGFRNGDDRHRQRLGGLRCHRHGQFWRRDRTPRRQPHVLAPAPMVPNVMRWRSSTVPDAGTDTSGRIDRVVDSFFYGDPGDVAFLGDWNCNGAATPA